MLKIRGATRNVATAFLFATIPISLAAATEVYVCADDQLSVVAAPSEFAALACDFALRAKRGLVECGLSQSKPIQIYLVDTIEHDVADCLATYNCSNDTIRVTDPASISDALGVDNPYRILPTEVVFQALITHEMAHALLEQSSANIDIAFVDHEYVAAAMELDIIAPEWRNALIAAAPVSLPPKLGLISSLIYGFEPRKFATNAWQFFNAEPDGCKRIREIASGEFTFTTVSR
jgi:hypothetical protein